MFSMAAVQTLCIPEELLFSSPQDINRRTKKVLQTLGAEALQAGNPHNLSSSCLHGKCKNEPIGTQQSVQYGDSTAWRVALGYMCTGIYVELRMWRV